MQDTDRVSQQIDRQFLHLCLRGLWHPPSLEAAVALAGRDQLDWTAFCHAAGEENLAPLLYHIVHDQQAVPATVEGALREAYYRLAGHNSLLLHELEQILRALAEDAVPVLLLKGAALVETAYGNAALRPMVDLDLLVPKAQVGTADRTLDDLGYRRLSAEPWPGFTWRYRYATEYCRASGRGPSFYVGLHTHLLDVPFYEQIPIGDWFARSQPVLGAGSRARMPAPEDHLVYLCGHQALQHPHEPALLRFVDIALLTRWAGEALDWSQVVERAVDWRMVVPLQRTLARLQELWPDVVPPGAAAEVARLRPDGSERRVQAWLARHDRTPASDALLALATMPGIARRAGYLVELAFPGPGYMRQRYCPRRPGLWPLAYLRRAGLAFGSLLRRIR